LSRKESGLSCTHFTGGNSHTGVNRNDFVAPVTLSVAKKSAQNGSAAMYHCRVCSLIAL
jgi:hypothetical protein